MIDETEITSKSIEFYNKTCFSSSIHTSMYFAEGAKWMLKYITEKQLPNKLYIVETRFENDEIDCILFVGSNIDECKRFITNNLDFRPKDKFWFFAITSFELNRDQYNDLETESYHGYTNDYFDWYGKHLKYRPDSNDYLPHLKAEKMVNLVDKIISWNEAPVHQRQHKADFIKSLISEFKDDD